MDLTFSYGIDCQLHLVEGRLLLSNSGVAEKRHCGGPALWEAGAQNECRPRLRFDALDSLACTISGNFTGRRTADAAACSISVAPLSEAKVFLIGGTYAFTLIGFDSGFLSQKASHFQQGCYD